MRFKPLTSQTALKISFDQNLEHVDFTSKERKDFVG